jgi:hypothetical protein
MNPILKNILAVIAGVVIGSIVNMFLVSISTTVIPLPEGVSFDPNDQTGESLKAALPFFEPKNFIMPFLAHALGTLVGAYVTVKVAATKKFAFAMGMGGWFFIGGIMVNFFVAPGPTWFTGVDLLFAYFPMAWIGFKLAGGHNSKSNVSPVIQ